MIRKLDSRTPAHLLQLPALAAALLLAAPPAAFAQDPAGIEITRCIVYSEMDKEIRYDCSDEARKVCAGQGFCELPIGLNLTEGRDLDGNDETWELVRVDYACSGKPHINGPHHQNDHATMTLACQR